jgi:hemolysin III
MQNNYPQSKSEEFLNAFSHILASAYFAYLAYESLHIVAILYGAIFSSMFFASFLYHAETPWKSSFRLLDQFFIYIVIGASGILIPDALSMFQVTLFITFLALTFIHHLSRWILNVPEGFVIPLLYFGNGALSGYFLIAESSQLTTFLWLGLGGYLVGFLFYLSDHIKYFHTVWHIMCCLGSYFIYAHLNSLF